jgi:hypothetical protein
MFILCALICVGCASTAPSGQATSSDARDTVSSTTDAVSITTFRAPRPREFLEAVHDGAKFEARDGCLYVGTDQVVWFFGTTVRPKAGSNEFEVLEEDGRKLAETGTIVRWGGGQVSSAEAAQYNFVEKLAISDTCASRNDDFWVVGMIDRPRFESTNEER